MNNNYSTLQNQLNEIDKEISTTEKLLNQSLISFSLNNNQELYDKIKNLKAKRKEVINKINNLED